MRADGTPGRELVVPVVLDGGVRDEVVVPHSVSDDDLSVFLCDWYEGATNGR
jgi:hypothetical protein